MGESQTIHYEQLLREARERFAQADDLTVSVEEEFALLDPSTLDMVNRFEELQAAVGGTPLAENLAGELIASEVEIKTGRQPSIQAAAEALPVRRAELLAAADGLGLALGTTGSHPWADWKEQRIIDTPHYRRNDELLRYVVWKNNTFGLHVHVGVRDADRAIAAVNGVRNWLPELLALSASSPFAEGVNTGLHSARTQIFTRFFPRCGLPDTFTGWDEYERYVRFLYETRSVDEHTQLWWSVRPHLAFPTVEVRICDAQPDVGEAQALAALVVALVARVLRAHDEGEQVTLQPHRLLEENLWRAIRWGLAGELIDLERGEVLPARARLERLVDWVLPVAEEIGAAGLLRIPEQNAAERQIARFEAGAGLAEIYGDLVVAQDAATRA
ncbi:MAG: carboxylate-amine ligase [Gaiella sp.]